ncbi:glycosyltransferase [Sulfitobacter sp. KE29]|uniref:glycosyltransferase n=1 Tax=unclassified Sulfitobacter TaxID=196795 RepID=UPI0023E1D6D3|nr:MULTISPECIES: glycosyltransferase [unclassified Sulfitobacter]MDF3419975.1 glycosyltransferase [Sulfitobacter sp. Ks38]MDF3427459.1 glycosyltransferase [Sulfitobacter sp. KE29]MDF3431039.1 glycosyltransferase [Sulfitobacter sp. S46]MDF3445811.1 glycosyltransferase [Sulfitobacter sp. KE31]MDF3549590.1 glycosyltransferase [Sulfitobacter sp. KE28]
MRLYVDARLPWGSGIGRYVASILPHMMAARPDWSFVLGVHKGNDHPDLKRLTEANNVSLREISISPFSLEEQRHLHAAAGPHDLAWFTNYWVPFFWPSPYAVTVHDLLHLRADLFPAPMAKRLASRAMLATLRRRARAVIFVSDFTRREFIRTSGTPRSGRVIHHGADHFPAAEPPFSKTRSALIVGAPKLHKNMALAIEAWAAAAPPEPWRLTVVSPGDALRSAVPLGTAQNSVVFRSGISNAELARLYREAAAVLFPTKYEGFGFPVLEAALNGARILSSTAEALQEVARSMDAVFLDPDDKAAWVRAIREMLQKPLPTPDATEIRQNIAVAQSYRWSNAAQQTLDVLEQYRGDAKA